MLMLLFSLAMLIFLPKAWYVYLFIMLLMVFLTMFNGLSNFPIFLLSENLNMNNLGFSLSILSFWILSLVLLASFQIMKNKNFSTFFSWLTVLLLLSLILVFSISNYIMFYVCFEISLIPTLMLILGWGYQPERVQAGVYMLFYTLLGSMPLLVCILLVYEEMGSSSMLLSETLEKKWGCLEMWYMASVVAFVMKLPVYFAHLWLPKAHVEAPVAGSMVLAGVLLKLGGYGIFQIIVLFPFMNSMMSWFWPVIGLTGGVIVGFMCLRQVDMKALIAYSSVSHMGIVLAGLVIYNWWGLNGSLEVMLGHGLCSSGLFFLASVLYERSNSRSFLINKGALNFMPSMCLWWFLFCVSNMAAPPTLNLLGEISLMISIMSWSTTFFIAMFLLCLLSGCYSLYLYSFTQHGKLLHGLHVSCSGVVLEYLVLSLHWLPLNLLILKSSMVMSGV